MNYNSILKKQWTLIGKDLLKSIKVEIFKKMDKFCGYFDQMFFEIFLMFLNENLIK
jgi:hypothetical protein